jgi:hypothetical protein
VPQQLPESRNPDPGAGQNSLDDVRKRLQSFGYLNSRIERFYLSSLKRTASQFINRALLSLRFGILTGTLAALLMLIGTLLFNDQFLKNKLDILLLFLYFEIFFIAGFAFLEMLLIYTVAFVLRFSRGRTLFYVGQAISFLLGFAFLAYFFLWGKSQYDFLRSFSWLSLAIILVILVGASIFVAKFASLGFLVAFRESDLRHESPNWRRYGIALSLAAIVAILSLSFSQNRSTDEGDQPVAVLSTPDRWIVIGIDGISLEVLKRLGEKGEPAYLHQLIVENGVSELRTPDTVVPPVAWTTIATGVSPAEHGILMPEIRRWKGLSSWMQVTPLQLAVRSITADPRLAQRQPVSGYLRKTKTFWEILSDHGIRTGVVNWWGSWPARPTRGWNVSERFLYKKLSNEKPQEETFPPALFQKFQAPQGVKAINGQEMDHFYMKLFERQLHDDPVRVAAIYLPGLDILNHEFFEKKKLDPFLYTQLYSSHLRWLDDELRALDHDNPGYQLLVVFYRGRSFQDQRSGLMIRGKSLPRSGQSFSELQLTPLILYSCGLPVAKSMDSGLIRAVYSNSEIIKSPIRLVESYRKKTESLGSERTDEFNDLLVEQMRSLGYLQ